MTKEKSTDNKVKEDKVNVKKSSTPASEVDAIITKATFPKFYKRAFAFFIDFTLINIFANFIFLIAIDKPILAIFLFVILDIGSVFYFIYMSGRFGQTIGKMIMNIKIVTMDGDDINYNIAFKRYLPLVIITTISSIFFLYVSYISFDDIDWLELREIVHSNFDHYLLEWVSNLQITYVVIAIVILLANAKRRTIHDYIANTVIVNK